MVGAGYVGLVSGACFSEFGWDVVCVDKDSTKIEALVQGKLPIYEPGLDDLVKRSVTEGRLSFSTDLASSLIDAQIIFIAVGTPSRRGDGHADLSYVFDAVSNISMYAEPNALVVTKSTVPVGTGRDIQELLNKKNPNSKLLVAANPEFLREGSAIEDFMRPDRIIIGAECEKSKNLMNEVYRPLFLKATPIVFTSLETAEMIKYASNSFLATKITLMNEFADLCEKVGANIQDVARGIGLDGRIGGKFLNAGPGYGGSCFPKDTAAVVKTGQDINSPLSIVEQVIKVNENRKFSMVQKIIDSFGGSVSGKTVGILGLTFKPNTDDMRDSPSLVIIPELIRAGANIKVFDPEGMESAHNYFTNLIWCNDAYETMKDSDALVILTEWNQFRALDLERMRSLLRTPLVIDMRNIYNPEDMKSALFDYISIGREPVYGSKE